MKFVERIWWCRHSFCSPWDADAEYVVHYLIPWTSCRISRLKVKSKAKMALFETKIDRDEENHRCWYSFCSSWDADSEYVVHYLIPWTSCRISRLKVKSKAKMALFETKIVKAEENHRHRYSFCSSWDADSEYVVHYLIPWTSCRISRLKVKSKAKMALFETKIVKAEENHRCWYSFCSSWDADSEYVVHYLIPWTSCRISRLKVKSKAKMPLFRNKIFRDEEQHWCWVSFGSSWDGICSSLPDSVHVVQNFAPESEI